MALRRSYGRRAAPRSRRSAYSAAPRSKRRVSRGTRGRTAQTVRLVISQAPAQAMPMVDTETGSLLRETKMRKAQF